MDIPSIGAAIASVKALKDILQSTATLTVDSAIVDRINDARHQVTDALGALVDAQEERLKLLTENHELRRQIQAQDDWEKRKAAYKLQQTAGGAVVYISELTSPAHYACPRCIEKREIQILQRHVDESGLFGCQGCDKAYPVEPEKISPIHVNTKFDPRDF